MVGEIICGERRRGGGRTRGVAAVEHAAEGQRAVHPIHVVRIHVRVVQIHVGTIHVVSIPGSRNFRDLFCLGDVHASNIRVGSGGTPRFPESYFVNRAQNLASVVW